jgi:hypothetical protein
MANHAFRRLGSDVRAALALTASIALSACLSGPESGSLAEYARQAKRAGRASISFTEAPELTDGKLDDFVPLYSIVVARLVRLDAGQTNDRSNIYTWSVFHVSEFLSRTDVRSDCRWRRPPTLQVGPAEVAIPRAGGTVVIDGVSVMQHGGWGWWVPDTNRDYVFFAERCPDEVVILPFYGLAFEVTPTGRVMAVRGASFEYQRDVESIGTIDNLRAYLRKPG